MQFRVKTSEEKQNLFLNSFVIRFLVDEFRIRFFVSSVRIPSCPGIVEMRRFLQHFGTTFAQEMFQPRQDVNGDVLRQLVIDVCVPMRNGVDAFLDQLDGLTDGEDFLKRSSEIRQKRLDKDQRQVQNQLQTEK